MSEASENLDADAQTSLERIVRMATILVDAAARVEELKRQLEQAKEDHRRLEQEDLPQLMLEVGLTAIRLEDGSNLELKPDVQCGISEARQEQAYGWLEANGFGGLIKPEVRIQFARDEIETAERVAEETGGVLLRSVHPATLKSFIKEQMAKQGQEGVPALPMEVFGVHPFNKAVLSKKKR